MTALYAQPDHQVIAELIPGIQDRVVGKAAAIARIRDKPGVVPVAIDPAGAGRIYWADLGEYRFREWQFMYTIRHLAAENAIADAFATDVDVLDDPDILPRSIHPRGFVFHVSRCGSTLLAKALARSSHNLVINQGGPLQSGFWAHITGNWREAPAPTPENLERFRRLVLAMTRARVAGEDTAFVKFISWNVLNFEFVKAAFPDVPCLFLYRDPVEVIASVLKETTAVLEAKGTAQSTFLTGASPEDASAMSDVRYLARCYANYFRTALAAADGGLACVNYTELSQDSFEYILEAGLDYRPAPETLRTMRQQFLFHSKDDADSSAFTPDSAGKQAEIPAADRQVIEEECDDLVPLLDAAAHNLFSRSGTASSASLVSQYG